MSNNTECARYFKSKKAYRRCMEEFRKKWKSFGKVAGRITLKDADEEERREIGGILGKVFYDRDISFEFSKFEQGLQRTRFAPVDMKEVLEVYFGETLSTNQGEKQEWEKRKTAFLNGVKEHFLSSVGDESAAFLWMRDLISDKKYGYQLLMKEFKKESWQAEILAQNVGAALIRLERQDGSSIEWPLAVFAAKISGNPHYFDRGTTPGQLLVNAICYREKAELPKNAHQWRDLLFAVGIVPDNVSSMVHAYGLRLQMRDRLHPAYDAFCGLNEPYVITMENLRGITGALAEGDRVYVVENEMVFCYLLEHAVRETRPQVGSSNPSRSKKLTLLCTSGQIRSVALELIPLILNSGVDIYYSGDIDPDGIGIADRLWQKFGERIHIWRMSPEDYKTGVSKERIDDNGLAKLENVRNPLLKQTAEAVKEKRRAAYQENLLEELLGDII
ncbi:MAG: TIGR02679 domain-containing protein [Clostridium sp.]|nr:TIGR02679 domain-containing protein [Acetatifactor muris]MCM1528287.1 TIGR02679 domain-containing protein [Bacteroides sp.]MCM1564325.1 TIGR02679 domain-containing protein [Clostridium sp.]